MIVKVNCSYRGYRSFTNADGNRFFLSRFEVLVDGEPFEVTTSGALDLIRGEEVVCVLELSKFGKNWHVKLICVE